MGIIKNGRYYPYEKPEQLKTAVQSTYKAHEHNRQRKDHSRELIQPFGKDGKLSEDFKQAWPEEAASYGQTQAEQN